MSIHKLICIFLFLNGNLTYAGEKSVLLVGNSLTYYNDMPAMVQAMCDEYDLNYHIEQSTFPGMALQKHLGYVQDSPNSFWRRARAGETAPTVQKILSKKWDFVILQEGPLKLLVPDAVTYEVLPALFAFDSLITAQAGKMVLAEPYTEQQFPFKYCYPPGCFLSNPNWTDSSCTPFFQSSESQFAYIDSLARALQMSYHISVAPVGKAFEICKTVYPEIQLYADLNQHPSPEGSFLIALVYFRYITGSDITRLKYSAGISPEISTKLKAATNKAFL